MLKHLSALPSTSTRPQPLLTFPLALLSLPFDCEVDPCLLIFGPGMTCNDPERKLRVRSRV